MANCDKILLLHEYLQQIAFFQYFTPLSDDEAAAEAESLSDDEDDFTPLSDDEAAAEEEQERLSKLWVCGIMLAKFN